MVAVILDHLFGWPLGGFVGVDVFFVISGFIITGMLLKEHDETGRISFVGFYRRRIKRIIPAATLVLAVTVLAAAVIFNSGRASQTLWDGVWAFFFAGNWHFAAAGTDYFQAAGPVSPLQHFWSLSVEEQFYFVWPWLMALIFLIGAQSVRWNAKRARFTAGVAMSIIIVASFAWAMWETANNPAWAYFSTLSRAWELGVGALIAVLGNQLRNIPTAARAFLGWVGLGGIIAAVFLTPDSGGFPAPWAALAVINTAAVIIAGTGATQSSLIPLTNPVSQWLGNISYSLYLWHFPVIVLLAALMPASSFEYYLIALGVMFALAVASYYGVENPIRKSHWLERLTRAQKEKLRRSKSRQRVTGPKTYVGVAAVAVVAIALAGFALLKPADTAGYVSQVPADSQSSGASAAPTAASSTTKLSGEISSALAATSWPDAQPSIDDVIAGPQVPKDVGACGGLTPPAASNCVWGAKSATKTAVIIGDSTALAYVQAFRDIVKSAPNWNIRTEAMFGCSFVDIPIENANAAVVSQCPDRKKSAIALIRSSHPDLVIVTNTYEPRTNARTHGIVSTSEWTAGIQRLTKQFSGSVGKVVFLSPPPSEANVQQCYTKLSSPGSCITNVKASWDATAAAEGAMAVSSGALFIDSREWFCVNARCPAFVGTTPVKLDLVHITSAYADKIAPDIRAEFRSNGLF